MTKPIYRFSDMINYFNTKGIAYSSSPEVIESFLSNNNYFYKLTSYRKNFNKSSNGKYINLSFEMLSDLASLDMQLRYLIIKMCLDIEHRIKTLILSEVTNNTSEDGYSIISDFISSTKDPSETEKKILGPAKHSKYNKVLYEKNKKSLSIWVVFEMISFGTLVDFVNYYIQRNTSTQLAYLEYNLYSIKNLRNTAAHSSSLLNDIVGEHGVISHFNCR